jgi:hypothetical protein
MTTVSMGGGLGLQSRQRKRGLNNRLFPSEKDGDHPTQIFKACVLRRALAGDPRPGTTSVPEAG